jgi:hypothetical protein
MNAFKRNLTPDDLRAEAAPWPAPETFSHPVPPILDFDRAIPDCLYSFREFALATAEEVQVPADSVAALALGIVSLAASRSFEVQLLPQWRETAPLWIAVLAEPGDRKSASLAALTPPLHRWQTDERERLRDALAEYAEKRRIADSRLAVVRKNLANAEAEDVGRLQSEAMELARSLGSMEELAAPDLLTADATPEAIRGLLIRNGEKVGLAAPETDFQQLTGSRYGTGSQNLNLMLAGKSGDFLPAHRVGRDQPLEHPSIACILYVQPAAVRDVLRDANANGRGLVQRFAFIQPLSLMGSRLLTPPQVPARLTAAWDSNIRLILDRPWPGRVVLTPDGLLRHDQPARILTLEPAADELFCALRADIEPRLKERGDLRPISGFASKLPGDIARIALAFQLMCDVTSAAVTGPIMKAACEWAPYLIAHHQGVLGSASEGPELGHARRLVDALRRNGKREISARECFRLVDNQTDLACMADFEPVLDILQERNYLRPIPDQNTGRGRPASPRYEVNPAVFSEP